ncbi:MAG TPA: sulfite exporter TauE/SafE family protein [Phycisphaerae bacterium]|nr:sulfite exporter TauE/SafE family protein [Phycisphaerae bacterium]
MYFPVSGIEVQPWVPPLAAFAISLVTSTGGVSGAFLLLPFQVSVLGFVSPSVTSTNHLFNVIATPAGVWRYWREHRMLWPLGLSLVAGAVPGVLIGLAVRILLLPDAFRFRIFAGCVLLAVALRLVQSLVSDPHPSRPSGAAARVEVHALSIRQVTYSFAGQVYHFRPWVVFIVALIVGLVGGAYGIGGGALIAPILVGSFRLPVYTIAGATLFCTAATSSVAVVASQTLQAVSASAAVHPDWRLGLLFGAGGVAGMWVGARLQKYVPQKVIISVLIVGALIPAVRYLMPLLGW